MHVAHPWILILIPICLPALLWWQYRIKAPVSGLRTVLRLSALVSLVLVLAGVTFSILTTAPRVLFLVDVSASMKPLQAWRQQRMTDHLNALRADAKVSVMAFAERAVWVEKEKSPADLLAGFSSMDAAGLWRSSLQGWQQELNSLQSGSNFSRVVVLSDAWLQESDLLSDIKSNNHMQWIIEQPPQVAADCAITSAELRDAASAQIFRFHLRSTEVMTVQWVLSDIDGGQVLAKGEADVSPVLGYEGAVAVDTSASILRLELQVADAIAENNHIFAVNPSPDKPRAVLFSSESASPLIHLMPQFEWQRAEARGFSAQGLQGVELVVIDNLPARDMPTVLQGQLLNYVRSGGNLFMMGYENAFGPGGWGGSVLEEALPVDCRPRRQEAVSILVMVDRSGSMSEIVQGSLTRIQMVKDAVLSGVVAQLDFKAEDRLSLLAFYDRNIVLLGFDDEQSPAAVKSALGRLGASGKTNLADALRAGLQQLIVVEEGQRQCILLSDGEPTAGPTDAAAFRDLGELYASAGIAVTVLAAGDKRDSVQAFADAALGRVIALDYDRLESLLQAEAGRFRSLLQHGDIEVEASGAWTDLKTIPNVQGYVLTSAKEDAVTALAVEGNPLLATWHVGAGRSTVFTTALRADTAADWEAWDGLTDWSHRLAETAVGDATPDDFLVSLHEKQVNGEQLTLQLEWQQAEQIPWNHSWTGRIRSMDGDTFEMTLHRQGAHRLQADIPRPPPGAYALTVEDESGKVYVRSKWFVIHFHPEWLRVGPKMEAFQLYSEVESVTVLQQNDAVTELPEPTAVQVEDRAATARLLLIAGLLLTVLELGLATIRR